MFSPYFTFKDLITIFIFIIGLCLFVLFIPNMLGDSENYVIKDKYTLVILNVLCTFILQGFILTIFIKKKIIFLQYI